MKHIMVECSWFKQERGNLLNGTTISDIYGNSDRAIIDFARQCGFLNYPAICFTNCIQTQIRDSHDQKRGKEDSSQLLS